MPELGVPAGIVAAEARLEVDGQEQAELSAGLLSLSVEESTEGLYRCEARFGNWGAGNNGRGPGYLYLDRKLLDLGKTFAVTMGAGEGEAQVFRGRITALEAQYSSGADGYALIVLAEDRAQDLRMIRRTRTFESMSDSQVLQQIAGEHGLQAQIDISGPTHTVLAQVNQSDLAFIRERARWLDADVWLDDRTLHVQARARRMAGNAPLTLALNAGLLAFNVIADLAGQRTSVVASGWDVAAKERVSYMADQSALGSELGSDRSGASILQQTLGPRIDRLVHDVPLTAAEAQGLAEAAFRAQARRFVSGSGVARGDGRLRVGVRVQMQGLGDMFDGVYYVTEARHLFARRAGGGYTTEFVVERPGIGL